MQVVILAGGFGTRLGEETGTRPKPLIDVGGKPILWHIMKHYSKYGFNEFVILAGYKGHMIKDYFASYFMHSSSIRFDLANNSIEPLSSDVEPWKVTVADTGINTLTGGRVARARELIGESPFMLTYGDGVSNVDIEALIKSHQDSKKLITMTGVQPRGRFGALEFDEKGEIETFREKPQNEAAWINGGFFICEPGAFDYIKSGDSSIFEREVLESVTADKQLNCYRHNGFWKCMDTLADKNALEALWNSGEAEWKTW